METSVGCNGQVRYYENRGEILHAWCPAMYTKHRKDKIRKREREIERGRDESDIPVDGVLQKCRQNELRAMRTNVLFVS